MSLEILAYPIVLLLALTSTGILVVYSWRWAIILLAIQYTGVFVLAVLSWPIQLALAKVIAGWITAAVLWMSQSILRTTSANQDAGQSGAIEYETSPHISGWIFRFFAATIVVLVVLSVAPEIGEWLPQLSAAQIMGALVLIGIGLMQLGLTSNPFWTILGLLTVISGFEVVYAGVEISALVQGLLAGVTLGLGLVGAYLILSASMEPAE